MFERFTKSARLVVVAADNVARERGDKRINATHLLLGVHTTSSSKIAAVLMSAGLGPDSLNTLLDGSEKDNGLSKLGIDKSIIASTADQMFGQGAFERAESIASVGTTSKRGRSAKFTNDAKAILEQSLHVALARKDKFICDGHLAIAAISTRQPPLGTFLATQDIDVPDLQQKLSETINDDHP